MSSTIPSPPSKRSLLLPAVPIVVVVVVEEEEEGVWQCLAVYPLHSDSSHLRNGRGTYLNKLEGEEADASCASLAHTDSLYFEWGECLGSWSSCCTICNSTRNQEMEPELKLFFFFILQALYWETWTAASNVMHAIHEMTKYSFFLFFFLIIVHPNNNNNNNNMNDKTIIMIVLLELGLSGTGVFVHGLWEKERIQNWNSQHL